MHKKIIFIMSVFLVFGFSGIVFAEENPFKGMTQDQVIQKYFNERKLDSIEGIWLNDDADTIFIVKANLINANNEDKYDYFMVTYSSSANTKMDGVHKTEHSSWFERGKRKRLLRFLSPTTLQSTEDYYYDLSLYRFYTRIYPNEIN